MGDKIAIFAGLAVFLVLATSPIWYTFVAAEGVRLPDRVAPTDDSHCIEDDMVAKHMGLLNDWRDEVVRKGLTEKYTSVAYPKDPPCERSLTKTCMTCHRIKGEGGTAPSCSGCHDYADVHPICWDCHLESKGD